MKKLTVLIVAILTFFQNTEEVFAQSGSIKGTCADEHIDTAIGCVPINNANELASFFLKWGIGIAGGIALLFIGYSGILLTMSSGDPKKTQAAKELLTASISGMVFLIFSILILRIVGIDILQIPGLQ